MKKPLEMKYNFIVTNAPDAYDYHGTMTVDSHLIDFTTLSADDQYRIYYAKEKGLVRTVMVPAYNLAMQDGRYCSGMYLSLIVMVGQ